MTGRCRSFGLRSPIFRFVMQQEKRFSEFLKQHVQEIAPFFWLHSGQTINTSNRLVCKTTLSDCRVTLCEGRASPKQTKLDADITAAKTHTRDKDGK